MPSSDAIKGKPLFLFLLPVAVLFPLTVASQTADGTLSGLIGSIKAQKEAALDPRRSASPPPDTKPKVLLQRPPIVWSIFGLNQTFSAVVVIEGKTHVLRNIDLPYRTAGWSVLSMDDSGLRVQGHGRVLLIPAPNAGTRPELYLRELNATAPSNNANDVFDPGMLSHPLPLQSSQLTAPPLRQLKSSVLSGEFAPMPPNLSVGLSPSQMQASGLPLANSPTLEKR
jgi:hypothetical protein